MLLWKGVAVAGRQSAPDPLFFVENALHRTLIFTSLLAWVAVLICGVAAAGQCEKAHAGIDWSLVAGGE